MEDGKVVDSALSMTAYWLIMSCKTTKKIMHTAGLFAVVAAVVMLSWVHARERASLPLLAQAAFCGQASPLMHPACEGALSCEGNMAAIPEVSDDSTSCAILPFMADAAVILVSATLMVLLSRNAVRRYADRSEDWDIATYGKEWVALRC